MGTIVDTSKSKVLFFSLIMHRLSILCLFGLICHANAKSFACQDTNPHCANWAEQGECKKNAGYMDVNCPQSCGKCSTPDKGVVCSDTNPHCAGWATQGECQKNPTFMKENCLNSCGFCTVQSFADRCRTGQLPDGYREFGPAGNNYNCQCSHSANAWAYACSY